MRENSRRSATAESVAALRAAGARVRDPALRNPDDLAEKLIGPRYRLLVRIPALRSLSLLVLERRLPGLSRFVTARTKRIDEVLLEELRGGARQVVVLGAGADSRAYRFANRMAGVVVFEVDHPATGEWKCSRVRRVLGAVPDHVRFVPVEFNAGALDGTLDGALDAAGVSRTERTVFLWEGVTPYLEPSAVDATLASIGRFATGSSVVFDYFYDDAFDRTRPHPEADRYLRYLAARGEPVSCGLEPARLADHLAARGLRLVDDAGPEQLSRRYLDGSLSGITGFCGVAHARVP